MDSFQERKHKNVQVESDPFFGHLWNQTLIGLTQPGRHFGLGASRHMKKHLPLQLNSRPIRPGFRSALQWTGLESRDADLAPRESNVIKNSKKLEKHGKMDKSREIRSLNPYPASRSERQWWSRDPNLRPLTLTRIARPKSQNRNAKAHPATLTRIPRPWPATKPRLTRGQRVSFESSLLAVRVKG